MARWASKPFLNGITNPSENNEHYVPPENGCSSVVELEHHPVELSERRQTTGRWSAQSSTNDAPQVGFIEDFNRDLAPQVGFIEDFNRDLAPQVGFNGDFTLSNRQLTGSPLSKILDLPSPFSRIDTNSSKQMLTTAPGLLELRERVNALNQKWIKELTSHHGPDVRFFSLSTPFEKGIQSLQKFYRGTLLITFEDVFALMHIVHACASIYHGVDEPHFWHAFFLDILQWYRAIATDEDKLLFLKVAFRLWCVPGYSLAEAARYFDGFVSQPSLQELYTELKNNSSIYFNYSQNPGRQVINPSMTASFPSEIDWGMLDLFGLHNALSGGQVISLWTRYLKGKLLLSVFLSCLELKIIDSEYAKFPLSSSWPNASCATDPDEVLSIFYELQKKRPLVNTLVGEENHFDGKVSSGEQQYKSPISMKSGQSDNTLDSPATTLTCSTLIGSPGSDKYNATFTPNSTPSSSAVEHEGEFASPTSNTSLRCDICDESFRGKKEDQRSNLNRHIRTVHESNPVPCSEPECDKTFGRRDNMERHRRKSHGDPGSPNPSKRRRITGT